MNICDKYEMIEKQIIKDMRYWEKVKQTRERGKVLNEPFPGVSGFLELYDEMAEEIEEQNKEERKKCKKNIEKEWMRIFRVRQSFYFKEQHDKKTVIIGFEGIDIFGILKDED